MCISLMEIAWVSILTNFSFIHFPPVWWRKVSCVAAEPQVASCVGEPNLLTRGRSWRKHHWQQWDQMPSLEKWGENCFRNRKNFWYSAEKTPEVLPKITFSWLLSCVGYFCEGNLSMRVVKISIMLFMKTSLLYCPSWLGNQSHFLFKRLNISCSDLKPSQNDWLSVCCSTVILHLSPYPRNFTETFWWHHSTCELSVIYSCSLLYLRALCLSFWISLKQLRIFWVEREV